MAETETTRRTRPRRGGEPAQPDIRSRREPLMRAAAEIFAAKGFEAASMRDIASAVGMLPGSLYYYFPSKDELFAAIHAEAVAAVERSVEAAVESIDEPWARLEAAAAAHVEALLGVGNMIAIVTPDFPESRPELAQRLVAERDRYERRFRAFLDALDLPDEADRSLMALMLLGALNWVPRWYHPGRLAPGDIGRRFVRMLRAGGEPR